MLKQCENIICHANICALSYNVQESCIQIKKNDIKDLTLRKLFHGQEKQIDQEVTGMTIAIYIINKFLNTGKTCSFIWVPSLPNRRPTVGNFFMKKKDNQVYI